MNKPRIPRTPARSLAVLAAVTLGLLAGWAVFRAAGRGALDVDFRDADRDPVDHKFEDRADQHELGRQVCPPQPLQDRKKRRGEA